MSKSLKRFLKYCKRFALGLLAFILIYVFMAFALSRIPVNTDPKKGDVAIYINSNGVHTDIVVPIKNEVKDWSRDLQYIHTKAKDSIMSYVAFGWGDKGFYLETPEWSDLKVSTAAVAAFHLGTSAMHTQFYKQIKEDDTCVKIMITKEDYAALVKYISESFQLDENKKVRWLQGHAYNNYDAFYEANRKYSLFYTCNTWANNALKAANQKAALWTPSDTGIFCHYK
jgi:uncharacterized protein (TIGR02117 family)